MVTLMLWGMSAAFALIGLVGIITVGMVDQDLTPVLLLSSGTALAGLLLLPSAWYSLMRLLGRLKADIPPFHQSRSLLWVIFPVLLFPLILLSGNWIIRNTQASWLVLPPLHLLAIGLPIFWLTYLGVRGLTVGSSQRDWGVLGAGLTLSPIIIIILEIGALLIVGFIAVIYIFTQPDLVNQIDLLVQRLTYAPPNPQVIQRILAPYLLQPGIIYTILAFVAVIVPLIEEIFKPIGVWLLFRYRLTPAAGFAAGILGGAGFATFESIMHTISTNDWFLIVLGRSGTAVMHIVTGGMMGWALASTWRNGKYLQLGLIYLAAVCIHALWNGLTMLSAANQIVTGEQLQTSTLMQLISIAPIGLGVLVVFCFCLLVYANWAIRRKMDHSTRSAAG